VLEVDVDIGRLVAFLRDEAREQKLALVRIDRRDVEAITDRAVRRRAAALTKDVLAARERDHVMDGEEVARVVELGDDRELFLEPLDDVRGKPVRV
jgi:hypothetical protein